MSRHDEMDDSDKYGTKLFDDGRNACRQSSKIAHSVVKESPESTSSEIDLEVTDYLQKLIAIADASFRDEEEKKRKFADKFHRLVREWKSQRGPHSSSAKLAMHPAYQKIIGMGIDVVPLILQELKNNLDSWFWALVSLTDEDPVLETDKGNGKAMARAWIEWGRQKGYQVD